MRRQPDVERASLCTSVRVLVLEDVAGYGPDPALSCIGVEWACATTTRRILAVDTNDFLTHDGNRVIQQRSVFRDLESWPRPARYVCLPDRIIRTGTCVTDRLQCRRAHGFCRPVDDGGGVL